MKVGSNSNTNLAGIEKTKTDKVDIKSNKAATNARPETADLDASAKVELSDRAQQMKKIKEIAMAGEEINQDKVAKFQKLIDEGKYSVDPADIADRMVDEHLMLS